MNNQNKHQLNIYYEIPKELSNIHTFNYTCSSDFSNIKSMHKPTKIGVDL